MKINLIDGAIVIDPTPAAPALTPANFDDKPLTVETAPAFYVALGQTGLMERSVSVTVADRKTVAALVGNWIAEGFQPVPCDIKTYAKHVRNLAAANKPAKSDGEAPAGPAAAEPGGDGI